MHTLEYNVPPPTESICVNRHGYIFYAQNNCLRTKIRFPSENHSTYYTETTFVPYTGNHPAVQSYKLSLYLANTFNRDFLDINKQYPITTYGYWRISVVRIDKEYPKDL